MTSVNGRDAAIRIRRVDVLVSFARDQVLVEEGDWNDRSEAFAGEGPAGAHRHGEDGRR